MWGCRVSLSFPVVKLRDYNERWSELEASDNPFAIVVMSHLKARATRGDKPSRLRWKMRLVRGLYEGGWERRDVLELLRFIDWVLALPPQLESLFEDEVRKLETESIGGCYGCWADALRASGDVERLEEGELHNETSHC